MYEFIIQDHPRKKHGNTNALSRTYKEVKKHSEDDNFLDAQLFAFDVEKVLREYKEVVEYLLHHKFPKRANKWLKGQIALKSRPYTIFEDYLYHGGKDGVLRGAVGKEDVPVILSKLHEGICGRHFASKITIKKILHNGYH